MKRLRFFKRVAAFTAVILFGTKTKAVSRPPTTFLTPFKKDKGCSLAFPKQPFIGFCDELLPNIYYSLKFGVEGFAQGRIYIDIGGLKHDMTGHDEGLNPLIDGNYDRILQAGDKHNLIIIHGKYFKGVVCDLRITPIGDEKAAREYSKNKWERWKMMHHCSNYNSNGHVR